MAMKLTRLVCFTFGLFCAGAVFAQEPAPSPKPAVDAKPTPAPTPIVKIQDQSPDNEFAMRIRYDPTSGPTEDGAPGTVQAIDLIAMPSGAVAARLMPLDEAGVNFRELNLVWSPDSNWCAFYYAYPRVGYTTVLLRRGSEFVETVKPEKLVTNAAEGLNNVRGMRNEYISPIRWIKPGTLLLRQFSILRTKTGKPLGVKYDLTAVFGSKKGELKDLIAVRRD